MLFSPLLSTNSSNDNDPSGLKEIAKGILDKSPRFSKGTSVVLITGVLILIFIITYSKIPLINKSISLEKSDLRAAFWIDIIYMVVFSVDFSLPEIIQRFRNIK